MREKLLTLDQARKWLAAELGIEKTRRVLWNWCYYGTQDGVKLRHTLVGGKYHTTPAALKEFFTDCVRRKAAGHAVESCELTL